MAGGARRGASRAGLGPSEKDDVALAWDLAVAPRGCDLQRAVDLDVDPRCYRSALRVSEADGREIRLRHGRGHKAAADRHGRHRPELEAHAEQLQLEPPDVLVGQLRDPVAV